MKKEEQKIKVVKEQGFIIERTPLLKHSLNRIGLVGQYAADWVDSAPETRAALLVAVDGDQLCFYRMCYSKKFQGCDNPDLAFALHMGCAMAGSGSLYAALKTGLKFCDDCNESYEKEACSHGKDNVQRRR